MNGTSGYIGGDRKIESLSDRIDTEIRQSFKQARMWMTTCFASFMAGSIFTLLLVWAAK